MELKGKGYYIWMLKNCEKGNPDRIVGLAREAKLSHVLIKIADGAFPYNVDLESGFDYVRPVIKKLQSHNIAVWGWQYIYGNHPDQEAQIAVKRSIELGVDGYVVNAEHEFKQPKKAAAASRYMNILRNNLGSLPIALSSYRFPSYHPDFPFSNFLERCNYNMPQVYWMKSINTGGAQLQRCINEYNQIRPFRPIIPTGPTFKEHGWKPQENDVIEFLQVAQRLNLPAVNFWYWEGCRRDLPKFWDLVRNYSYENPTAGNDFISQYFAALNSNNPDKVLKFYNSNAVHIRSGSAIVGKPAIREWVANLMEEYAGQKFILLQEKVDRHIHNFRWQVQKPNGGVTEGRDTMGVIDNTIRFHYSIIQQP
ncbi:MAG TPA: nuclear transport factor 2 family protein [Brevefilum sp.]|nr:nuclear transport factor 2 family protein [Brevefilum sp.]HOR19779.1 nuclear transport factor 2 family protein [Brevefilum sp.]HPL70197.1 nuclear transport factor 2 family protein [Brevefilum sp.]